MEYPVLFVGGPLEGQVRLIAESQMWRSITAARSRVASVADIIGPEPPIEPDHVYTLGRMVLADDVALRLMVCDGAHPSAHDLRRALDIALRRAVSW